MPACIGASGALGWDPGCWLKIADSHRFPYQLWKGVDINAQLSLRRHAVLILIIGFIVVFLSSSIKNTFQVFFVQMAESFGQSRGEFAVSAAVFMLVFGIASPIVGHLADRIGPKRTILLGILLSGTSFLVGAEFSSFPVFVVAYGVVAAFGLTAMSYVPMGVLVEQYVSARRCGLAYGTLTNGAAIGFMLLSPLWVVVQESYSWREVYWVLGGLFLVPMFLAVYFTMPERSSGQPPVSEAQPVSARMVDVFSSRPLFVLMLGFFGCGVTMAFIDVHMVAHLQDLQLSPGQISLALAVLGATELVGGFLAGWLCDRYPKAYVISVFYLLRAVSLAVIFLMPNATGALLFAALFGLSYLGTVVGTSMYSLGLFGSVNKGFAFGFIWLAHQVGAFASTQLGANAFDWFGSYEWTIGVTALVALGSAVISIVWLAPNPSPHRSEKLVTQ